MTPDNVSLIKMAVDEWAEGKLPTSEAMFVIGLMLNDKPPSIEAMKWALDAVEKFKKSHEYDET